MHHFIATARRGHARFLEEGGNPEDREPLPLVAELTSA